MMFKSMVLQIPVLSGRYLLTVVVLKLSPSLVSMSYFINLDVPFQAVLMRLSSMTNEVFSRQVSTLEDIPNLRVRSYARCFRSLSKEVELILVIFDKLDLGVLIKP